MKYLAVLAIAALPLVTLTAWSFLGAAAYVAGGPSAGGSNAGPAAGPSIDDAEVEQIKARADAELAAAQAWLDHDLLRLTGEPTAGPPEDSQLAGAADRWRAAEGARRLLARYRAEIQGVPDGSLEGQKQLRDRLRHFAAAGDEFDGVAGASAFLKELARRADELDQQIRAAELAIQYDKALKALEKQLAGEPDADRAQQVLDELHEDPLEQAWEAAQDDAALGQRLQTLEARASCRRDWAQLRDRPVDEYDRGLEEALQKFLADFTSVPLQREEKAYLTAAQAILDHLHVAHWLDDLRDLTAADDLPEILELAVKIIDARATTAEQKEQARQLVRKWVETRALPSLKPPPSLQGRNVKEAHTKDGQKARPGERLFGIFAPGAGGEKYYYWSDDAAYRSNDYPLGERRLDKDTLRAAPDTPRYVAWADQYNDERERLLAGTADARDWQALADGLATLDELLRDYRAEWKDDEHAADQETRSWDFRALRDVASQVVEHWEEFAKVVGR